MPNNPKHLIAQPPHGFLALSMLLILLLLAPSFYDTETESLVTRLIVNSLLFSSLYLVAYSKKELLVGLVLAIPTLLVDWAPDIINATTQQTISNILYVGFLGYICYHILRYLFETTDVSMDMIFAALCLYLLLAIIWTFFFLTIEIHQPGSFKLTSSGGSYKDMFSELLYYSYVTISTLGYGDITPLSHMARAWASLEAVLGQLYLACVVARLVGLQISNAQQKIG